MKKKLLSIGLLLSVVSSANAALALIPVATGADVLAAGAVTLGTAAGATAGAGLLGATIDTVQQVPKGPFNAAFTDLFGATPVTPVKTGVMAFVKNNPGKTTGIAATTVAAVVLAYKYSLFSKTKEAAKSTGSFIATYSGANYVCRNIAALFSKKTADQTPSNDQATKAPQAPVVNALDAEVAAVKAVLAQYGRTRGDSQITRAAAGFEGFSSEALAACGL